MYTGDWQQLTFCTWKTDTCCVLDFVVMFFYLFIFSKHISCWQLSSISDDGGFLATTPERKVYERRIFKDSQAGQVREATTPERANNNADTLTLSRGRAHEKATKNGNLLRESSSEIYWMNGTPERRHRVERDSSPDSNYSRDELNYAAAPRLKDYYSMKNNAVHNNAAYNTGHNNNAVGHSPNQLPEPKRRLYKESPKDLSI